MNIINKQSFSEKNQEAVINGCPEPDPMAGVVAALWSTGGE